ncbi:MAG: carbon-nitrogen hydrolase family protein [Alphaproteobacteria bacterium]|nr:carbon-nitrogen hydrolase family protein [Alphaproteobacteria bacterium]
MSQTFRAACVQMRTGTDICENLRSAETLIREAHGRGAAFIATPEVTVLFEAESDRLFAQVHTEEDDPSLRRLRALAQELGVWLLIGSMAIKVGERQCANRSFLIGPGGQVVASYDKIHMFDVDLPNGETYRESRNFRRGERAVVADLPWGKLGLSVCYDLRFPQLYRALAKAGASFLTIPAAFTHTTGMAHWHVLQRARAIETGCYVIAPAQGGHHANGRHTFGHSLVVAPWGEIIAEAGTEPCVITADIDPQRVADARGRVPSLLHDKPISVSIAPDVA